MKKIYVNEKWCLGCHLCEYYCAFANSGESDMVKALKGIEIHPRIRIEERGNVSFAVSCRHCDEPLCVKSCISGALTEENGIISIDPEKCVGCYTCIMACPYGAVMPSENGSDPKVRAMYEKCRRPAGLREGMPQQGHCFRGEEQHEICDYRKFGGGRGNASRASAQVDGAGSITVISDEAYHTYSRPLISYLLCGKTDRGKNEVPPG